MLAGTSLSEDGRGRRWEGGGGGVIASLTRFTYRNFLDAAKIRNMCSFHAGSSASSVKHGSQAQRAQW